MPSVTRDGLQLHYIERGSGDETIVFSHSFLLDHRHFEPQIAALEEDYRIVAYDHRSHGESGVVSSAFEMQDLVDDGIRVLEETVDGPCHFVGLSTGGFVGMRIGLQRPDLVRSLVLMSTSAKAESFFKRAKYDALTLALKLVGWRAVIGQATKILFGPTFVADPAGRPEVQRWRERIESTDEEAVIAFGNAIWSRDDVLGRFGEITVPTLVILGEEDLSFTPEEARAMADAIPDAEFLLLPDAGHICTLTHPGKVNDALRMFFERSRSK